MRDFWEEFLVPVGIIAATAVGGASMLALAVNAIQYVWEKDACSKYGTLTGATTFYSWSTPCYVKGKDGRWLTLDTITKNSADVTVRESK